MQGLFVTQPGELAIGELPLPTPGPYEALVKTRACAICSSTDTKLIHGEFFPGSWPMLLGHETFGEIVEVGSQVQNFARGEQVLRGSLGDRHTGIEGGRSCWGGFAEYTLVTDVWARDGVEYRPNSHAQQVVPAAIAPVDATILILLKENLSFVSNSDVAGQHVAILGAGAAGQAMTVAARELGAKSVVVFARSDRHRDRVLALGADEYVVGDEATHGVAAILQDGGFGRVLEAVGDRAVLTHALSLVAADGKVCVYGIPPESEPYRESERTDPRVVWPAVAEATMHDRILQMVADGRIRVAEWVTDVLPWHEFQRGFDLVWSRTAQKVVLTFE